MKELLMELHDVIFFFNTKMYCPMYVYTVFIRIMQDDGLI